MSPGDERVEEVGGGALFGIVTESKPKSDSNDKNQSDGSENQRPGFMGDYRGRIEK